MIVGEILKENDFRVVKDGDGFNVVSRQSGEVVGRHRIRGGAAAMARDLNNGPKFTPKTNGTYQLELDGKTYSGESDKVLEELVEDGKASKDAPKKAKAKGTAITKRIGRIIVKAGVFKLIFAAQLAQVYAVFHRYASQRAALEEMWAEVYPEGHPYAKGSPYAKEMINKTLTPYLSSAYAALGALATEMLLRALRAGKAIRIARGITAAIPPASPWTAVAKGLLFVVTEGAVFAATWFIQKYGPDFFTAMANDKLDEYITGRSSETVTPSPSAPSVDENEVADQVANDPSGGSNDPEDIRSRIQQEPSSSRQELPSDRPDIGNIRFRGSN